MSAGSFYKHSSVQILYPSKLIPFKNCMERNFMMNISRWVSVTFFDFMTTGFLQILGRVWLISATFSIKQGLPSMLFLYLRIRPPEDNVVYFLYSSNCYMQRITTTLYSWKCQIILLDQSRRTSISETQSKAPCGWILGIFDHNIQNNQRLHENLPRCPVFFASALNFSTATVPSLTGQNGQCSFSWSESTMHQQISSVNIDSSFKFSILGFEVFARFSNS